MVIDSSPMAPSQYFKGTYQPVFEIFHEISGKEKEETGH